MSRPLRLGDRVTVTSTPCGRYEGFRGRLRAYDVQADILEPYHVSDGRGRAVWASTVHRERVQYPELPYRALLVVAALLAVAVSALVAFGLHETSTAPADPAPSISFFDPEAVPPFADPQDWPAIRDTTERA
nr:hypothetical protein OG513_07565 [Streptomyces sp. NBC_00998]